MSIRTRIFIAVALLGLTAMLGCIAMGFTAYRISAEKDAVARRSLDAIAAANDMRDHVNQAQAVLEGVVAMTRLSDFKRARAEFDALAASLDAQVLLLQAAAISADMTDGIARFEAAQLAWESDAAVLLGVTDSANVPTRELMRRDAAGLEQQAIAIAILTNRDATQFITEAQARMTDSLVTVGAIMQAVIAVVSGFVFLSGRRMSQAIIGVAQKLRLMAGIRDGDDATTRDEITQMRAASDLLEGELASFQATLGRAARQAALGDLSVRVAETASQDDLRAIAIQLNQVFIAMETATSATSQVLRAFAAGDLRARIRGSFAGVFADLQRDGNLTGDKLYDLVSQIKDAADRIKVELQPIHTGAIDLSRRAASQAERLSDTSATMARLSTTVQANAKSAAHATALSQNTSSAALQGGTVAGEAIAAIRLVSESARQINEITGYVDDIAFQTNLLSLNAAVEAARAGDAGRSFAVVAHEVRMLAVQAADASSEIKRLITQSARQVGSGVKLVEATGSSLTAIHDAVHQVVEAIRQISRAVQDQSQGVGAISEMVSSLEHETGLNARLASDSVSAVGELTAQIARLNDLVAFFQTEDGEPETRNKSGMHAEWSPPDLPDLRRTA